MGDSKFTAHHTVLVEMCLHLKPPLKRVGSSHKTYFVLEIKVKWKVNPPLVGSSLSFHRLFASVTELADVSASEADVFMALRVRVPPLAFLMTVFCKGA